MMSLVWLVLIVIFLTVYRWKSAKHIQLYNQLKTDLKCFPIIGHAYLFYGNSEDRIKGLQIVGRKAIDLGGIGAGWFANKLYLVVADPEIAEVVLKSNLEKDFTMKFMRYLLGDGTIIASVPTWRVRRKILTASFSVKNLNGFVEVFSRQSQSLVDRLQAVGPPSQPFSILKTLSPCIMDIVYECVLGIKIECQEDPKNKVVNIWDEFRDVVTDRMCKPWIHTDLAYKILSNTSKLEEHKKFLGGIAKEVILDVMKDVNHTITTHTTFLENLVRASKKQGGYTHIELQKESFVLTMAASDSSTVGSSFTCLMLAKHPEVQEQVFEELKKVFGNSTRPVTPEDLLQLKYLEAVIKETLRLFPPIPVIVREVLSDVTLPTGVTLLKGTSTLINIWAMHRNPKYWGPDAEEFRPERFLDLELKHLAQFMPFSYGPRNCLGPQFAMTLMKTVLSNLMRKFKILPSSTNEEPIRLKFDLTMKDANEFLIRLEPRVL